MRLPQAKLGKLISVDPARISDWERGIMTPGLAPAVTLERISQGMIPCGSWLEPEGLP
jgi:transcriptional regulator with XRE-family HTH domain